MRSLFDVVVVPVDGSGSSFHALEVAAWSTRKFGGGEIIAVSVIDEDVVRQLSRLETPGMRDVEKKLEADGMRNLALAEKVCSSGGVGIKKVIRRGIPYLEIVEEARERDATMIIIGRVGRRGPRRIRIGSVTERVIEYASCPVMVIAGTGDNTGER
ncbi:MAG: universal stress protein [Firmicutes bacterium]|nr:universal stress protein [Bacillota bacterium]